MKKIIIMVSLFWLMSAPLMAGIIFTNITYPVTATGANIEVTKTGYAKSFSILGLFTFGDAGINAATKEGNISQIAYIDKQRVIFPFGLFWVDTLVVSGK